MLFDLDQITERQYALLIFALHASEAPTWINLGQLREVAMDSVGVIDPEEMLSLVVLGLIRLHTDDPHRTGADAEEIEITPSGVAVLVNGAPKLLEKAITSNDVPDEVLATLIPLLDVRRVPAADRYVSTADNQEQFAALANELETVKGELLRDQNANELPFPVQEKRAMVAELDGLIGQIKAGYVRLSDLTQRARPLIKNIADTCKDVGVIAAAAYAAYEIIGKILAALF